MKALNTSKTRIIVITAISLAFVLLCSSMMCFSSGFRFKQSEISVTTNESFVYDGDGNLLESGKVYPLSSNLIFTGAAPIAAESSGGVTVQAVIIPDNATDKTVDWVASWVNPAAAFASGKAASDYIKITPEADGSLIAKVFCLQAFGEQINITVISRDTPSLTASCTADYVQRIADVIGEFTGSGLGDSSFKFSKTDIPTVKFLLNHNWLNNLEAFLLDLGYTEEEINSGDWTDYDYTGFILSDLGPMLGCSFKRPKYIPAFSAYTLADNFSIDVYVYPSAGYSKYCENAGYPYYAGHGVKVNDWFFPEQYTAFWLFNEGITNDLNRLRSLMTDCAALNIPQLEFTITVTGTYSSFTKSYPAWVDINSFKYPVTGLQLDTGSLAY